jgi:hypothetical protein
MAQATAEVEKRLVRLPHELNTEFPHISLRLIEGHVARCARELIGSARFQDYVPVLVHKAVRERLRASQRSAEAGSQANA